MNIVEKLGITPGPWHSNKALLAVYSDKRTETYNDGRDDMHVCQVDIKDFKNNQKQPMADNNLRLIAAAPEMLEALINACKTFEWYTELHYKKYGVGHEKYTFNKRKFEYLKDIIEKATDKTWAEVKELLDE